jgi:hypothetical protein
MNLLFSRIILTGIILAISYFALQKVWTEKIDLIALFKRPSIIIPTDSTIKISPNKIILNANEWKGKSSFNIYNGTGEMFYDLYIKLELKDSGISSQDIELTPHNNSDFMKGQIGNMSISFDIIQFKGIDSNDKECIYLILYSLAPNQNQDFLVGLGKLLNTNNRQIQILVKLMQSSKVPPNMLSRGNEVSYPINFPEKFTVREQSMLMKKEKG